MLSEKQQKTIENSIWVVNTALKRQGLQSNEDLRQSAILYMCKCLERFDPNKNIKWSTFAYKNVFLFIKRTHNKETKKNCVILGEDIFDLREPLKQPLEEPQVLNQSKCVLESVKSICSAEERQILDFKLQGYTAFEISVLVNCSTSRINSCIQSIKNKARSMSI